MHAVCDEIGEFGEHTLEILHVLIDVFWRQTQDTEPGVHADGTCHPPQTNAVHMCYGIGEHDRGNEGISRVRGVMRGDDLQNWWGEMPQYPQPLPGDSMRDPERIEL